jgi:DNA-binding NarL/FixJ family response regulator
MNVESCVLLIVEDDRELSAILRKVLEKKYQVHLSPDGASAVKLLQSMPMPDLIISDVIMPRMDGFVFIKEVRRLFGLTHVPFLFMSIKAGLDDKLNALADGAVDYIVKPFSMDELEKKIENLMRLKQRIQEKTRAELKEHPADPVAGRLAGLTSREQELARMVAQGLQDKEIAGSLGVSTRTVSNALSRIYRKTGLVNRVDLLRHMPGFNTD